MTRTARLLEIAWVDGGGGILLCKDVVAGVTGMALGSLSGGGPLPVAIYLFVALTTLHGSATGRILVAVVLDPLVAVLTGFTAVHGRVEIRNHDLKSAPIAAFCVTANTLFGRIGLAGTISCEHQQEAAHKRTREEENSNDPFKSHDHHRSSTSPDA
jgi:hypothetical protein